jgi:hypothetical protein
VRTINEKRRGSNEREVARDKTDGNGMIVGDEDHLRMKGVLPVTVATRIFKHSCQFLLETKCNFVVTQHIEKAYRQGEIEIK